MTRTMLWFWIILAVTLAVIFGVVLVRQVNNIPDAEAARFAEAIALAEGFYQKGSRPQRNHNPGDIKADLIGKAVGYDDEGFPIFANDDDGWQNLERQVQLFYGGSHYFNSDMTIAEVAGIYTGNDNAADWARIVAGKLGVSPDTRLNELVTG